MFRHLLRPAIRARPRISPAPARVRRRTHHDIALLTGRPTPGTPLARLRRALAARLGPRRHLAFGRHSALDVAALAAPAALA